MGGRGWQVSSPTPHKPLTVSLRDATAADLDPERLAAAEAGYRRGVHQALAFAGDIADRANSLRECQLTLARPENIAGELRYKRKNEGRMMLLDCIRGRLSSPKRGGSTK
jgi:hypothetical protein